MNVLPILQMSMTNDLVFFFLWKYFRFNYFYFSCFAQRLERKEFNVCIRVYDLCSPATEKIQNLCLSSRLRNPCMVRRQLAIIYKEGYAWVMYSIAYCKQKQYWVYVIVHIRLYKTHGAPGVQGFLPQDKFLLPEEDLNLLMEWT